MRLASTLIVGLVLASPGQAVQQHDFTHWAIAVPEGTRLIEAPAVPLEGRERNRIELVEDLVIAERAGDLNYAFYNAFQVAADHLGRIYVLDTGNQRVQVFDQRGEYLFTLGGRGQGPGELLTPFTITVAGERVTVSDSQSARLVQWSLGGELVADVRLEFGRGIQRIKGLSDGSIVGTHFGPVPGQSTKTLVRVGPDGTVIDQYADLPSSTGLKLYGSRSRGRPSLSISGATPSGDFAVSESGEIYLTACDEYQILALTTEGDARWALRVPWPRRPFSDDEKAQIVEEFRARDRYMPTPRVEWPERLPALNRVAVDGHGHLYVFPYSLSMRYSRADWPVDVYSAEGDHLFSGTVSRGWYNYAVQGDFIYTMETDEATSEMKAFRYRLVEPF